MHERRRNQVVKELTNIQKKSMGGTGKKKDETDLISPCLLAWRRQRPRNQDDGDGAVDCSASGEEFTLPRRPPLATSYTTTRRHPVNPPLPLASTPFPVPATGTTTMWIWRRKRRRRISKGGAPPTAPLRSSCQGAAAEKMGRRGNEREDAWVASLGGKGKERTGFFSPSLELGEVLSAACGRCEPATRLVRAMLTDIRPSNRATHMQRQTGSIANRQLERKRPKGSLRFWKGAARPCRFRPSNRQSPRPSN